MFRSATFKLTLWYLAIITGISLVFSVVIYHFAATALQAGLHSQTMRIYRNFPVFNGSPLLVTRGDLQTGEHHILLRLIDFNVLVVILAGVASYFLARRTLQPIEAAHRRQQRFTADVSHELRTPLTSLKMSSEVALLDTQATKPALREALASNLEEADKMNILINNLLRLTKLDDDEVQAGFAKLKSSTVIATAIEQTKAMTSVKQITITQEGKAAPLYGDEASLVQLLVILLDNAVKYSPEKSTVTINTTTVGPNTLIRITDKGAGISPEALPYVFDRFYRADASRAKGASREGYGLGLSIAKLISDRHRGIITLTSQLGMGTTASIELPSSQPTSPQP